MPSVALAEQPGADHSEDVVLVLRNAVALLDGATSLRPTVYTGGWYAQQLTEALRPRLSSHDDLADLLAGAIAEVTETHALTPGQAPSSTVSLLRWDAEIVEALVLADSPIVVFTESGEQPVTDNRLANLRVDGGGFRGRLRSGAGFGADHEDVLRAAVERTSRWRNVDGGFWVAEAQPHAAYRATRMSWPRADVRAALLASDGVSCGVDEYGLYATWSALLDEAESSGPQSVLDRVRAAEKSDPEGQRWPRAKRHDDQALAVVHF